MWPKWQQKLQGPLKVVMGKFHGRKNKTDDCLRRCLNTVNDEAEVTCGGSVFQFHRYLFSVAISAFVCFYSMDERK